MLRREDNLLVSIIVITYNSAKYVLETLESAKVQTYQNIELIVSDDCSMDDTVEICKQWIEANKERFVRVELITVPENTGIPGNCNRGVNIAQGEWVKLIAGDDLLFSSCIEKNMKEVDENSTILLSEVIDFIDKKELNLFKSPVCSNINPMFKNLKSAHFQFLYFLKGFYIPGSAIFIRRNKLIEVGGYDEKYTLVEDRPLFLKFTYNDLLIKCIIPVTIAHRIHSTSITANYGSKVIPQYVIQVWEVIHLYASFYHKRQFKINALWHLHIISIITSFGNKGVVCNFLNRFRITFQPLRFYNLLTKLKIVNPN